MSGQTYLTSKSLRPKKGSLRLNDLKLDLDDDQAPRKLLADLQVQNVNEKEQLRLHSEEQFPKWLFYLRQGFSLLLYGFGSKRQLLQSFAVSSLTDAGVLAVTGQSPGLTAKQVLIKAASMLQRVSLAELKGCTSETILQRIAKAQAKLYIVLHNIEGSALRSSEAQGLLAELSALPNISLVASMDHVNTPLLWDKQMAARFDWLYFDVTNYAPYYLETANVPSLLVGRREESTMQGAAIVLRTLVPNARRIFSIIAEQQIQDQEQGLSFQRLFKTCREQFLVSSEMTLRSHLTEFKDHQLVHTR